MKLVDKLFNIVIIVLLIIASVGVFVVLNMNGFIGDNKVGLGKFVNSIDELTESVDYDITIPKIVTDQSNLKYIVNSDDSCIICNEKLKFEASRLKDSNNDNTKSNYLVSKTYSLQDIQKSELGEDIDYVDYLVNDVCNQCETHLKWVDKNATYEVVLYDYDGINGESALFNELGISSDDLHECDYFKLN